VAFHDRKRKRLYRFISANRWAFLRILEFKLKNPFPGCRSGDPRKFSQGLSKLYFEVSYNALYAWDFPAARDKKLLLTISNTRRIVDILEIGDLVPFKFSVCRYIDLRISFAHSNFRTIIRAKAVSLDVRAEGYKQVLRITNYNPDRSLYKPRTQSNLDSTTRQDTISSSAEAFEVVTEDVAPSLTFKVEFAGIGISLINKEWWKWSSYPWTL